MCGQEDEQRETRIIVRSTVSGERERYRRKRGDKKNTKEGKRLQRYGRQKGGG
jgi:hypothetical protein